MATETLPDPLLEEIDRRLARLTAARDLLANTPDMAEKVLPKPRRGSALPGRRRGRPRKNAAPEVQEPAAE